MPFLFLVRPTPDDNTLRKLALVYSCNEMTYTNQSGWTDQSSTDDFEYYVALSNMEIILGNQLYYSLPLGVPIESWNAYSAVNIGSYGATIMDSDNLNGYDVWLCMISTENGSLTASYDRQFGVLVTGNWTETNFQRIINLQVMTFSPPLVPFVRNEGVLLAGIFVELAVIIGLLADRLKKS
ncbi:MAG: hypothetical protein EAX87_07540 [Candidatus Thorarchaeota archaeon]|nr:hypothetical protein [Candidatus Thorarchaeota archaeon]